MTRPAAPGRRASCPPAEQLLLEGTSSTADGTAVPTPGPDVGGGLAPAWALTGALSPRRAVRVAAVDASTGEVLHLFPGTALVSGPCP